MKDAKSWSASKNPDRLLTTKHGHRIVPYKIKPGDENKFSLELPSNIVQFALQPRVRELAHMLEGASK